MFCPNCGQEVFAGERFCKHCGAPQQTEAAAPPSSVAQPATVSGPGPASNTAHGAPGLTDYHTFDWLGTCPTCGKLHTAENTRCLNDGSPIVVAFAGCREAKAAVYPLHAATLCCLRDCGFSRTMAIQCSGCDCGSLIGGKHITFRFPEEHVRLHKRYRAKWLFLSWVTGIAAIGLALLGAVSFVVFSNIHSEYESKIQKMLKTVVS